MVGMRHSSLFFHSLLCFCVSHWLHDAQSVQNIWSIRSSTEYPVVLDEFFNCLPLYAKIVWNLLCFVVSFTFTLTSMFALFEIIDGRAKQNKTKTRRKKPSENQVDFFDESKKQTNFVVSNICLLFVSFLFEFRLLFSLSFVVLPLLSSFLSTKWLLSMSL